MSDAERSHQGRRARATDRSTTNTERRNRSRSPHADGGRHEGGRYRSRSPLRREARTGEGRDARRDARGRDKRGGRTQERTQERTHDGTHTAAQTHQMQAPDHTSASASKDKTAGDVALPRADGMDDESWAVVSTMGFSGFKSTKNTKVPGNEGNYGVRRDKVLEARQYMNRQGGFNRPLSPGRG